MPTLTPFLWFDTNAEDAANFYLANFPGAVKRNELRAPAKMGSQYPEGVLVTIELELFGQRMIFLNGGPHHRQTEAFSWTITCDGQQEIDHYWSLLTADGGREIQCGWLQDKFGVFWQVVPVNIGKLVSTPAGMQAMMSMKKFDIAALEAASRS